MTRAALLMITALAACASGQPAPIAYGGGGLGAPASSPASEEPNARSPRIEYRGGRQVRAEPQEVQEEIVTPPARAPAVQEEPNWADGEGTALSQYALQPGDAQPFDPARLPRSHRVDGEESLYDIASRYQVPLRALIDQNRLEPPYALSRGQELTLPPPRFHTMARGESFEDVAQRYNVDERSLALLNRMQPPYRVRPGERVVLPAMARGAPASSRQEVVQAETSRLEAGAPNARFAWPLRGEIVGRFGAQSSGARLDGVEIAGREGAEIAAAADGDVVYAGSDLAAYGTLVLVRHADNYVTAYAYARRALVREGERVRAGQAIAELGGPRLLFQVRRGSTAVDPAPLLGSRQ